MIKRFLGIYFGIKHLSINHAFSAHTLKTWLHDYYAPFSSNAANRKKNHTCRTYMHCQNSIILRRCVICHSWSIQSVSNIYQEICTKCPPSVAFCCGQDTGHIVSKSFNHAILPMLGKQLWSIRINSSHQYIKSTLFNEKKTKLDKTLPYWGEILYFSASTNGEYCIGSWYMGDLPVQSWPSITTGDRRMPEKRSLIQSPWIICVIKLYTEVGRKYLAYGWYTLDISTVSH